MHYIEIGQKYVFSAGHRNAGRFVVLFIIEWSKNETNAISLFSHYPAHFVLVVFCASTNFKLFNFIKITINKIHQLIYTWVPVGAIVYRLLQESIVTTTIKQILLRKSGQIYQFRYSSVYFFYMWQIMEFTWEIWSTCHHPDCSSHNQLLQKVIHFAF